MEHRNVGLGEGSALPVGVPVPWPSATLPEGWLKCNGAAFSSEMYPKLAKAYPRLCTARWCTCSVAVSNTARGMAEM
ncbi:phage tail protein [Salmonella enterica]|uniref:phage tail protein n=1 Tax=Salmonella enterica TaxID=28901 RepID=UPI001F598B69|nr:phage tail protein [Salmonella enterica]